MTNPQEGDILELRLSDVKPTQPPDDRVSTTVGPIEVIYDRGNFFVQHGNHRYYDALDAQGPEGTIKAEVVRNFYLDY